MVSAAIVCLACSKEPETYKPGGGSKPGGGGTDKPSTSKPDYSKLTASNHPRVILTKDAEASIKAKIESGSDENVTMLHKLMIDYANSVLNKRDLTYQKVGKRLLDVSVEAANRYLSLNV